MMSDKRIDQPTGTEFVGHEWDGIEELNTPLPRWWLWTFYATIAWALVYVVLYPAWPLIDKATDGTLGWSSRGDLAKEMSAAEAARQGVVSKIAATDIEQLAASPELMQAAVQVTPRLLFLKRAVSNNTSLGLANALLALMQRMANSFGATEPMLTVPQISLPQLLRVT